MQIVSYPDTLIDRLADELKGMLGAGAVAEGHYVNGCAESYVDGKLSLPVNSGGAAILAWLAYQKHVCGRTHAFVQSNTMRALFTVPRLLGLEVVVVDSCYAAGMAMDPQALRRQLADNPGLSERAVVVYSVIGGYLPQQSFELIDLCADRELPLLIDAAHAHYLDRLIAHPYADLAFSFYATKILPSGEGGLLSTARPDTFDWIGRFSRYDRFANELEVGLNMRASEFTAFFIHTLMTDPGLRPHFRDARVEIAQTYRSICLEHGIRFLDPAQMVDFNGYKFIVLSPHAEVAALGTPLTRFDRTSGVFDTDVLGRATGLPHWCPPTYASLAGDLAGAAERRARSRPPGRA